MSYTCPLHARPRPVGDAVRTLVRDDALTTAAGNGRRGKDKRPNIGPAAWRHQNRYALNEAHIPFDFLLFFFAITPTPSRLMRLTLKNDRALLMNAT